jgi:hypothetical protein
MSRIVLTFGALVSVQAIHSVEEYYGRLWESFPPARFLTGLFASDPELVFAALNALLVGFGVWCLAFPVRRRWASAGVFLWLWAIVECINGIVHPLWSLREGGYTPGVATAPLLLALAIYLAVQLRRGYGVHE